MIGALLGKIASTRIGQRVAWWGFCGWCGVLGLGLVATLVQNF